MSSLADLSRVFGDLKGAARRLQRAPVFSLSAILLLGLGMGVGTTAFSVVNATYFKPRAAGSDFIRVTARSAYGLELDLRETEIARLLASPPVSLSMLAGSGKPRATPPGATAIIGGVSKRVIVESVAGSYFDAFGATSIAGRLLAPYDGPGSPVAVISERLWQTAFGRSAATVGTTLIVGGQPVTVVGIVAAPFRGASASVTDIWVPSYPQPVRTIFGRLRGSATLAQVNAELQLRYADPDAPSDGRRLEAARGLMPSAPGRAYVGLAGALAVGLLVSVIAAGSLVLLLLARLSSNEGDMAVRLALGATARDLTRLLACEVGLLAAAATGVAVVTSAVLSHMILSNFTMASGVPLAWDASPDWRVVCYVAAATAVIAAGVITRFRWTLTGFEALGSMAAAGGIGGATLRTAGTSARLVIAQTAATTALLLLAAIFARSALSGFGVTLRLDVDRVAVTWIDQTPHRGSLRDSEHEGRQVLEAARTLPGVTHAAVISRMPGMPSFSVLASSDGGTRRLSVNQHHVTPELFDVLGLVAVRGRTFTTADDRDAADVVVLGTHTASALWPGLDPVGRRLAFLTREVQSQPFVVVGVVQDVGRRDWDRRPPREVYLPLRHRTDEYADRLAVVVRGLDAGPLLAGRLRAHVQRALPETGQLEVRAVADELDSVMGPAAFLSRLVSVLGLASFVVAMTGLYGLTAHLASRRRREMAIRRALGATAGRLCRMLAAESGFVLTRGIASGVLAGLIAGSLATRSFPELRLLDVPALAVVAGALFAAGFLGSILPFFVALRARHVALRE